MFDDAHGGSGACLVERFSALEAEGGALSGGAVRGRGEVAVKLARVRSPALSGLHVCDQGAASTVLTLSTSRRGRHGDTRWTRGYLLDILGRPGVGCGARREEGGRGGSALFHFDGHGRAGDKGTRWLAQKREGRSRETREGRRGAGAVVCSAVHCCLLRPRPGV